MKTGLSYLPLYTLPTRESRFGVSKFFILMLFICILNLGLGSAVGTYPQNDPSMVLYYHFNNQSAYGENDTRVYDFSGNGNNGTVVNMTWNNTNGILNDGAFQSNENYPNYILSNLYSNNLTNFTISIWFKVNNINYTTDQFILGNDFVGTDSMYAKIVANSSYLISYLSAQTTISDVLLSNTWYNYVVTSNSTLASIYLNGVLKGTNAISFINPNKTFIFGVGQDKSKATSLNGSLDEIIVYNKTLSSIGVGDLYNTYYGCYVLSSGMTFAGSSSTICYGNYFLNTSSSNAPRIINSYTLNCNGSVFIGNRSLNTAGLYILSSNVTLINCSFRNYNTGILIESNKNHSNMLIKSSYFNNLYGCGIYMISGINITIHNSIGDNLTQAVLCVKNVSGIILSNNLLFNSSLFVSSINSTNVIIKHNYFDDFFYNFYNETAGAYNGNTYSSLYFINYVNNISIFNNTFINGNPKSSIWFDYGVFNNLNIYDNFFYNATQNRLLSPDFILFNIVSGFGSIYNNLFEYSGTMIKILSSDLYLNITNNTYINSGGNGDGYNVGILIARSRNINLIQNNFSKFGCNGILIQKGDNVLIEDNDFNYDLNWQLMNNNTCQYEIPSAIGIYGLWKGFYSSDDDSNLSADYITSMKFISSNITILNNRYYDSPAYLVSMNTNNLTNDFSNYWYRSFNPITYYTLRTDYWINNFFDNLSTVFSYDRFPVSYSVYRDLLGFEFMTVLINGVNTTSNLISYKVHKDYLYIYNTGNLNYRGIGNKTYNQSIFNQTNSLIYFSNNSATICNNDCNFTLKPLESVYVYNGTNISKNWQNLLAYDIPTKRVFLSSNINNNDGYWNNSNLFNYTNNQSMLFDDFNLTEGQNRQYSPIYLYSDFSSSYWSFYNNLTSNLTVPVYLDYVCSSIVDPLYYNGVQTSNYSCYGDILSLNLLFLPGYNSLYFLPYIPDVNESEQILNEFVCTRIRDDNLVIAHTRNIGSLLSPYIYSYESGCKSYTGSSCSTSIFSNSFNYTLLYEGYSAFSPIWAEDNTCLYEFYNSSLKSTQLVQAWRVKGNGGQFCTIQGRWNYYVYNSMFPFDGSISLDSYRSVDSSVYEFYCYSLYQISVSPTYKYILLSVDWTSPFYIVLMVLAFIVVMILLYFRLYFYAGAVVLLFGFLFLYSGILWIISIIVIFVGIGLLMLSRGKKLFSR